MWTCRAVCVGALAAVGHDRKLHWGPACVGRAVWLRGWRGARIPRRGLCSGPVKPVRRGLLKGRVLVLPQCAGRPSGPS